MNGVPILFRHNHVVQGASFEAFIRVEGRALLVFEGAEWNCDGVEPGGLTRPGEKPDEAFERFRQAFRYVLDDLAEESHTFEEFRDEARMFFVTNPVEAATWDAAFEELTRGAEPGETFRSMQRAPYRPSSIRIELPGLTTTSPALSPSEIDTVALPIAA